MLLLVLKSCACLAVFMLFYKLFLEKESVHVFKRFYLLGAILISVIIPFITFTEYIEAQPVEVLPAFQSGTEFSESNITEVKSLKDYLVAILWVIYLSGVVIFSIRFVKNLIDLIIKIRTNPSYKYDRFINVLLNDLIPPHTFFNYIFLNKTKYENKLIPQEVLIHEQTHARQKHALDILFIEVLQIIFWFNPLVYIIKRDIKLNHEFLADQVVLATGISSSKYKKTLLAFSSGANSYLANAMNYSSIKKRFTVMKTKTSIRRLRIRVTILLPLIAILILGFSNKVERVKGDPVHQTQTGEILKPNNPIIIEINNKGTLLVNNENCSMQNLSDMLKKITKGVSKEEKKKMVVQLSTQSDTPKSYVAFAKEFLRLSGFTKVSLNNSSKIQNLKPENISPKFYRIIFYLDKDEQILTHGYWVTLTNFKKALVKHHSTGNKSLTEIELIIRNGTSKNVISQTKAILSEFGELNTKFTDGDPWKGLGPKQKLTQQEATSEQLGEYNRIAKKYNTLIKKKKDVIVKQSVVNRLTYLYNLMSDEQKQKYAEPFPKFPPPPAPEEPEIIEIKEVPPPPPPVKPTKRIKKDGKIIEIKEVPMPPKAKEPEVIEIKEVPPPPPPIKLSYKKASEALIKAQMEYTKKGAVYGRAIKSYLKHKSGNTDHLKEMYKETMVLYKKYSDLSKQEAKPISPPPPPPPAEKQN